MNLRRRTCARHHRRGSANVWAGFLLGLAGLSATGCLPSVDVKVAHYGRNDTWFTFGAADDAQVARLHTGNLHPAPELEPIYVELRSGQRVFLPELTLEMVKPLAQSVFDLNAEENTVVCTDVADEWRSHGSFQFQKGRLYEASIVAAPGAIVTRVSLSKEGPYIPLSMTREQMAEMFGEPRSWDELRL